MNSVMQRVVWTAVIVLGVCAQGQAQITSVVANSLPTDIWISWDDTTVASTSQPPPDAYEVSINGTAPVTVPAGQVPCSPCGTVPVRVATTGTHVVEVRGRSLVGSSSPGTLTLSVTFLANPPVPPKDVRVVPVGTTPTPAPTPTPSPAGTNIPTATNIIANDLATWTLSAPLTTASTSCPRFPSTQCRALTRNGVTRGLGFELFVSKDLSIWARGYEGLWYRWSGSGFVTPQSSKPQ